MLEAEDGLHEFLPDAKSARRLVRVSVLPVPADLPGTDEVTVEVVSGGKKRTEVKATHRTSGQTVTIRPAADVSAEVLARELLAAEIARQERLRAGAAPQVTVRRWWFGPRPSVRDPRTGVSMSRIKDALQGDIDRFLVAHLERRGAAGGDAPSGDG
jgi:hypothetical protein